MTQGLYGALEEATKTEQPNKDIAQIVVEQFSSQTTLVGVAQGVVDRVTRIHHDHYMQVFLSVVMNYFLSNDYELLRILHTHHVVSGTISRCL